MTPTPENSKLMAAARDVERALARLADSRREMLAGIDPRAWAAALSRPLEQNREDAAEALRRFWGRWARVAVHVPKLQAVAGFETWEPEPWPRVRPSSDVRLSPYQLATIVTRGAEDIADDERWGEELTAWARDVLLAFDDGEVAIPDDALDQTGAAA